MRCNCYNDGFAGETYTSSVGSADTFPSEGKAIQFAVGCLII